MYRLNRSAAEIYYGRAREAAPREGLITDALDKLNQDLRDAAAQAVAEGKPKPEGATAEALLAQVAELRRALQDAQQQANDARANQQGERGQEGKQGQEGQQPQDGQPGQ